MEEQAGHGQALLLAAAEGVVPVLDLVPALAPAAKAAASGAETGDRVNAVMSKACEGVTELDDGSLQKR